MYIDKISKTYNGQVHSQYLLRTSKREGKKIIKTTILNLTSFGKEACEAMIYALKNKKSLARLIEKPQDADIAQPHPAPDLSRDICPAIRQGKSIGAVWLLSRLANNLGITDALGDSREGRLALWQILARTIDQGSRLSATRLAKTHEIDFLELQSFNENSLYANLDWLAKQQSEIETKLYKKRYDQSPCSLFLYDVTSSYFEGECNELAAFGYNRDKKRGKKQIVVGLLCDGSGTPVSVEVFEGNTNDTKTMHNQIHKTSQKFHARKVVFVGDRGMIKSPQQKELSEADFDFITALTKAQIEKLIQQRVLQLTLFDVNISEIILENGKRYILKRNPVRAKEIADNRSSKLSQLCKTVSERNNYLNKHELAKPQVALKYCNDKLKRLKLDGWIELRLEENKEIKLAEDSEKLKELSCLDGCYCLTTSLAANEYDKEFVHSRYKDLAMVENAFRTCKTGQLELRPIYVRKEGRTRAHVFVVMLSYLLLRQLRKSWGELDMTVEEGLELLETLCTIRVQLIEPDTTNPIIVNRVPEPREDIQQLFQLADIPTPEILPAKKPTNPTTRRKLKKAVSNKKIKKN